VLITFYFLPDLCQAPLLRRQNSSPLAFSVKLMSLLWETKTLHSLAKNSICGIFPSVMSFFKNLLLKISAGILGLYLADYFLADVSVLNAQSLLFAGTALGFVNFFIRPILQIAALPLRILTLGIFSFIINISIVWLIKASFSEIAIEGIVALFYTTIIIWILEFIIHSFSK